MVCTSPSPPSRSSPSDGAFTASSNCAFPAAISTHLPRPAAPIPSDPRRCSNPSPANPGSASGKTSNPSAGSPIPRTPRSCCWVCHRVKSTTRAHPRRKTGTCSTLSTRADDWSSPSNTNPSDSPPMPSVGSCAASRPPPPPSRTHPPRWEPSSALPSSPGLPPPTPPPSASPRPRIFPPRSPGPPSGI